LLAGEEDPLELSAVANLDELDTSRRAVPV
jgi:hypothetical protein